MIDNHNNLKATILELSDDELEFTDDEVSEDEAETWEDLEQKFNSKEDADVAVFLKITEQLTIESLKHLLQGYLRSKDLHTDQYNQTPKEPIEEDLKAEPQQKMFRWAEIEDNELRLEVHEIEPYKGMEELWWDEFEVSSIRRQLIQTIKFFIRHHQERIDSLEKAIEGKESELIIENHMKVLTEKSMARGIEGHISKVIPTYRKSHVSKILQVQMDCQRNFRGYNETCEVLRRQSLENSAPLKAFAERMGRFDEIEALKAEMCPWDD